MADIEKIISDLEQQIRWIEEIECHKFPGWLNVTNAMRDALALLKEQEAKPVDEHGRMFSIRYGSCPNCLKPIDSDVNPKACGHCGQAVKWDA